MGYASYEIVGGPMHGQLGGYAIYDTCGEDDCLTQIDRGMSYMCGRSPHFGGPSDEGCGGWFCHKHLYQTDGGQRCSHCAISSRNAIPVER